jgi:MFS family permease
VPGFFDRSPALRPLAHRDFRLLLAGSTLVSLAMPFQFLTQVFWVQREYPAHAVLYASLLSASRGVAMVAFSLIGGAIADRVERRRVLLITESGSLASNAVIAALMVLAPFGSATVAAVAVCTFFAAGVMSIDSPARSASLPAAAGVENIGPAIGLMTVCNQLMMPLSLPLVGILNGVFDPGVVYAGSLTVWAGILPLIAMLRYHSVGGARNAGMLNNIRAGVAYTRRTRAILAVLSIVLIVQLLGMPVATPLGPMFMMDVMKFSSGQVGVMGATWGLGAFAASIAFTRLRGFTLRGVTLAVLSIFFGCAVMGFGYSRNIPLTAVFDVGMGFGFTATMLTSSTLVQHMVDDSMRGRVMSLFPFSLGFAYVCTAAIGGIGQQVGLAVLIPALGWATVLGCVAIITWNRQLLGARIRPAARMETTSEAPVSPLAAG